MHKFCEFDWKIWLILLFLKKILLLRNMNKEYVFFYSFQWKIPLFLDFIKWILWVIEIFSILNVFNRKFHKNLNEIECRSNPSVDFINSTMNAVILFIFSATVIAINNKTINFYQQNYWSSQNCWNSKIEIKFRCQLNTIVWNESVAIFMCSIPIEVVSIAWMSEKEIVLLFERFLLFFYHFSKFYFFGFFHLCNSM